MTARDNRIIRVGSERHVSLRDPSLCRPYHLHEQIVAHNPPSLAGQVMGGLAFTAGGLGDTPLD